MIKPNKYTDPNCTSIEVIALVLSSLKANGQMKFDELYDLVITNKGSRAKDIFIGSLNVLFLLGKLEYVERLDIIGYIE
jgi:hypothetical protein